MCRHVRTHYVGGAQDGRLAGGAIGIDNITTTCTTTILSVLTTTNNQPTISLGHHQASSTTLLSTTLVLPPICKEVEYYQTNTAPNQLHRSTNHKKATENIPRDTMVALQTLLAGILMALNMMRCAHCFSLGQPPPRESIVSTYMTKEMKGDALREATGIRPSLHPTTINAIAEALKARAMNKEDMPFRVSDSVQPIDVAVTASKIASVAIAKRQEFDQDGMKLTPEEEQAIAGRVIGVIMRMDDLEANLFAKVSKVDWVAKYNEWSTFGVVKDTETTDEKIKEDPLLCMSRAECLLAVFMKTVEIPQLEKLGASVPDGSKIDFLDSDRVQVLFDEEEEHP
jgi:hypothetical protein